MDFEAVHKKAVEMARLFHEAESDLIDILQQIDEKRIFVRFGYSSLFDYATRALKLSEANASNFITVARKSKTIPELKAIIRSGELTVSKARKITPVLTPQNSSHWINLAKTLPKLKLEKEVAKVMPQTMTPERTKYVTDTRLELKLGVSEETLKRLRRAQDLVSQKTRKAATLEETLEEMLDIYLKKQDPVERAKRLLTPATKQIPKEISTVSSDATASVPGTRYIPSSIKHQLNLRDQGQCAHVDKGGHRCSNQRWIEFHHKQQISKGGTNDLENLETLCHSHHKQKHL